MNLNDNNILSFFFFLLNYRAVNYSITFGI